MTIVVLVCVSLTIVIFGCLLTVACAWWFLGACLWCLVVFMLIDMSYLDGFEIGMNLDVDLDT